FVEELGRMDGEPEARDFIQEIDARLIELKEVLPRIWYAEKPYPEYPVPGAALPLRQPPVARESLLYHLYRRLHARLGESLFYKRMGDDAVVVVVVYAPHPPAGYPRRFVRRINDVRVRGR